MPLTDEQLGAIIDRNSYRAKQGEVVIALNGAMAEAAIDTPLRAAMFLAQVLHETGGFRWFTELGDADYFAQYEGREDLGNTQPGDGARFRGRGFLQITGRANYAQAGHDLGIDLIQTPALASTLMVGARIAGWYWTHHHLNPLADAGDIASVTRRINGGMNGLADRQRWYEKALDALRET